MRISAHIAGAFDMCNDVRDPGSRSANRWPNRSDVLNVIFAKIDETGQWVKKKPEGSSERARRALGIDTATVEEANSHHSYRVGAGSRDGPSEQQKIADAFLAKGPIPKKIEDGEIRIWQPR